MVMLAVQRKEKELRLYQDKIDIRTLLKVPRLTNKSPEK